MARAVRCVDADTIRAHHTATGRLMTIGHLVIIWPRPEPRRVRWPARTADRRTPRRGGRPVPPSGPTGRLGGAETVTRNRSGSPPASAWAERATSSSAGSRGPPGRLTPSPTAPASAAILGPNPPTTMGGTGSGRRKPSAPPRWPRHTALSVATWSATSARRRASPDTSRPSASCSAAYGVSRPPPAPMPSRSRPPLSSWSVAAMTANVPARPFATLSTSGPTMMRGTVALIAESVVQH